MKKPIKRVAVLHDICGVGKAAMSNILPVLSVMGVEPCAVPTIVLSTHTGGFGKPAVCINDGYISEAAAHYHKIGIDFDGIFIGYLGNSKIMEDAEKWLRSFKKKSFAVIDPIFADNGRLYSNFNMHYVEDMKSLLNHADVVTPNLTEACMMCGYEYNADMCEKDAMKLAERISEMGPEKVVITSLQSEDNIGCAVYDRHLKLFKTYYNKKAEKSYPGTGDIFTAVLVGAVMNGMDIFSASEKAAAFTSECISYSSKYDYDTKEGVLLEKKLYRLM